jgi:hypothetical protein
MRTEELVCKLNIVMVSPSAAVCFFVLQVLQFLQYLLHTQLSSLFSLQFNTPTVLPRIQLNTLHMIVIHKKRGLSTSSMLQEKKMVQDIWYEQ